MDSETSGYGLKRKRDKEETELERASERQETEARVERKKRRTKVTPDTVDPNTHTQSDLQVKATQAAPTGRPQGPITKFFEANQNKTKPGTSEGNKTSFISSKIIKTTQKASPQGQTNQLNQLEGSESGQERTNQRIGVDRRRSDSQNHQLT